jgi:predicted aconitase with swiveling domain
VESEATVLVPGEALGAVLRLDEPLSFWGGLEPTTGVIIDRHHPQFGESIAGRILAMSYGRGSSSSTQVLAEALRLGKGPRAVVMTEADVIVMLGALVAGYMYESVCPVVVVREDVFAALTNGTEVTIGGGGETIRVVSTAR